MKKKYIVGHAIWFRISLIFLLQCISINVFAAPQNTLEGVRAWPSPDNTRVVLDFTQKVNYSTSYLSTPERLVIDLHDTNSKASLDKLVSGDGLVSNIRESKSKQPTTYRLVIDLKRSSKANIFSLPPAKPYGHRLVIDLPNTSTGVTSKAKSKAKASSPVTNSGAGKDIVIAIDAGHGGDDPGALGQYTHEKKVTLAIAKRLKSKIDAQKGMRSFLIRKGDYFVNLNQRSIIARKGKADFLVSIHADGFHSSQPKGASVWVLSNRRASSELGRWMENNEAQSELLGGVGHIIQDTDSDTAPYLSDMLLDMMKGNTIDTGSSVGHLVVKELAKVTTMHKKKPVPASLAVLKSPDIPSILVEAGFITNHSEERLLNQPAFQNKIANAVHKGIYNYFIQNPPDGSLFAQKKRAIKHTVRRGESLSLVAQRYSVSSNELKKHNNLKSTALQIGQVLSIPSNYQVNNSALPDKEQVVTSSQVSTQKKVHRVKKGESLSVIAEQYGTSSTALIQHNKLKSSALAIGQSLNIPSTKKTTVHVVKKGESLSLIATRYKQTTAELKRFNQLSSTSLLIGQKIKIPGGGVENKVVKEAVKRTHKVKRGESLSVIAKRYDRTSAQFYSYNRLRSSELAIGQTLKIPSANHKPAPLPTVHVVKRGQSLSVIAAKYGMKASQLKKHNKLRSSSLAIGQRLKIPLKKQPATTHKVSRGESLSVIAKRYGTTSHAIVSKNKLRSESIAIGQLLKIPTS